MLVPQFKAEAAKLARARPAADATRARPHRRKEPARSAQQAGVSAEHSRGDRQQQQPAAEQAHTAGVSEPAQADSPPSRRAAAGAEAHPHQVPAKHAGTREGPGEPPRSTRKRVRDGTGTWGPAAADGVKPEQPSDAESDEVQGGPMHFLSTAAQCGTGCCCCGRPAEV